MTNRRNSGGLRIGDVAGLTSIAPSAIRYYEKLGLLPKPARAGGKRLYDASVLRWLSLVTLARDAGFRMAEIRRLVTGFAPGTRPAERWRAVATRKLAEVDALAARLDHARGLLRATLECDCRRLEECGVRFAGRGEAPGDAAPPGTGPNERAAIPSRRRASRASRSAGRGAYSPSAPGSRRPAPEAR